MGGLLQDFICYCVPLVEAHKAKQAEFLERCAREDDHEENQASSE